MRFSVTVVRNAVLSLPVTTAGYRSKLAWRKNSNSHSVYIRLAESPGTFSEDGPGNARPEGDGGGWFVRL